MFPALVAIVFAVLVGANLNGSSMALLASNRATSGLIAGTPRGIRTDEFDLRTPLAISSALQGFPGELWIGLTNTQQGAIAHGGPVLDWSLLVKPQDWGYVLFGPSRGLAFSWWWSFAISLLGTYWLLWHVTGRAGTAAALAIAATFTPYAAWWTAPAPSLFLGYAALGGAAAVAAMRAGSLRAAVGLGLFAGLVGAALVLALYPPWQVTLGWIVAAITIGLALDRAVSLRRFALVGAVALTVAGAVTAAWLVQHREAVSAIVATIYPGQRLYHAGDASLAVLVDGPLNFWMTGDAGASLGAGGLGGPNANVSESASTWLSLPLSALLAIGGGLILLRRRRAAPAGLTPADLAASVPADPHDDGTEVPGSTTWTLVLTAAAMLLLLGWSLLPLPDLVGAVTLLQRVEPARTGLALGLGQIVLIAAAARVVHRPRIWTVRWLVVASVVAVGLTAWAVGQLPWNASLVSLPVALASAAALAVLLALAAVPRWAPLAAAALAVYALASWAPVNPLQRGIGPLVDGALPSTIRRMAATAGGNHRIVVYGGYDVVAQVRAAGLESVSGTTLYPDADLMSRLVPTQRNLWNDYVQYRWRPAPAGESARIVQVKGTAMDLIIDPCDPVLLADVDPGWVVSETQLDGRCLTPVTTVAGPRGATFHIYRYAPQSGSE